MAVTTTTSFVDPPVDGFTDTDPNSVITGTAATYATLNLTIPTHWAGYKIYAAADGYAVIGNGILNVRVSINTVAGSNVLISPVATNHAWAVSHRRTGMTDTGTIAVLLRADLTGSSSNWTMRRIHLYAIAQRTA